MLGEFEYLLIAAAVRLGDEAYGAAIVQEIERSSRRRCSIGALYTTLDRLEAKGMIKTWMGKPTQERVVDPSGWFGLPRRELQQRRPFTRRCSR